MPRTFNIPGYGDVTFDDLTGQITGGVPSNLTGTVPGGYDPAYGGVPQIPNPTASMWQALGGDMDSLQQLFNLGNAYNLFGYGQRKQQVEGMPGYGGVTDLLAGKLPQDVVAQLNQAAAERGAATGIGPESPNLNAAFLRAMGLTSLDAQQRGQAQQNALYGLFPGQAPFNLMDWLITSEQQQAANAAANTAAAAPNPAAAAREEERKMLEAIAAGQKALPPGVTLPGGVGPSTSYVPPAYNAPETIVGRGPAETINRGGGTNTAGYTTNPNQFNWGAFTPWPDKTGPGPIVLGGGGGGFQDYPGLKTGEVSQAAQDAITNYYMGQGTGSAGGLAWPGGGVVPSWGTGSSWWKASPSNLWNSLDMQNWLTPPPPSDQSESALDAYLMQLYGTTDMNAIAQMEAGGGGNAFWDNSSLGPVTTTSSNTHWANSATPWEDLMNMNWLTGNMGGMTEDEIRSWLSGGDTGLDITGGGGDSGDDDLIAWLMLGGGGD